MRRKKKLILYLIEIFVLNTFGKSKISADTKKLKQNFEDSLIQLIKDKISKKK